MGENYCPITGVNMSQELDETYAVIRPSTQAPRWRRVVGPSVPAPFYRPLALGNGTQYMVAAFFVSSRRLFIGIEGEGAYTFDGYAHPSYVAEKLGLNPRLSDASNMADFINAQLGIDETNGYLALGAYNDRFSR